MPSGSDFKYATGDTTAWKSKYYALVDYVLAVGGSVAGIEGFLAANSEFAPETAPTALASLNVVNATTSDNLAYEITHANPYQSLTPEHWLLVRMPSANAGAMTLAIDGLPAKDVYVNGIATASGEFTANLVYVVYYNACLDRFDAFGPQAIPDPPDPPSIQVFTGSGTWIRPAGLRAAIVFAVGGGAVVMAPDYIKAPASSRCR